MKKYAKQTALALAMALTVTSVAPATASAASAPKYKKEYNTVKKGKSYAYTVKNIKKGTKVKWSLVGTGKKYVSFNKSKAVYSETTKAAKKKTYSTNKIYIRKNTSKVVKVVVKASVTGKNGKKYSVTDKIAIAKTAAKPTATPATTATTAPSTTPSTAPSTTPAATATGAATATPSVAPTATSAATATPSVAPSASTTPSTAPTATASTNPSATPAATATTTPSAAPVVTSGAITVTSNATGASVKVLNGTTVVATGTIADGKAVLPKVANGNYVVEVSATGFITATKAVVVNGDVTVDVQLEASKEFTAKQTGRQKILVTGTNLSDKVADYVVKRGNASIAIDKVELDKTTATLTTVSSTLAAGDYTIELGTQKYAFKAEAEKTSKIEVIGTNLVLAEDNKTETTATIGFKVLNQFGERAIDVEPSVTSSFGNATFVAPTREKDGTVTVTVNTTVTPLNSKGSVVVVDKKTGLNTTATVTLSASATVDKIEVAGIYKDYDNSEKATKVTDLDTKADLSKYAILLKAYDQYGNVAPSVFTKGAVTLTAAGNTGIELAELTKDTYTVGQETYVAIPLQKSDSTKDLTAGSTSITIVGNKKGLLDTVMLTVKDAVAVSSIKLIPSETLYNKTKSEVTYLAKDTTGKEVTDYNTLNGTQIDFKANGIFKWERQKDGSAKLYFTPSVDDNASSETASQPMVVTTTVKVGVATSVDVANFTIYNAKKAKAIVGVDKGTALATVVNNGVVTLKAENIMFQDQYGNVLTDDEAAGLTPLVRVDTEGDIKGFVADGIKKDVDVATKGSILLNAKASDKADKTRLKLVLLNKDKDNEEITSSDYALTIQSVGIDDVSEFAVADLGQLYLKKEGTGAVSGNAIELKVTGKVGSTTVTLTDKDYTVLKPEHVGEAAGKIFAVGTEIIKDDKGANSSKTEKLEVVIGNKVGTSIKKDVVVSSIDPKADKVALKEDKEFLVKSAPKATIEAKKAVYDIAPTEDADAGLLEAKDQYGNKYVENARFQFTNVPEGFTVKNNNTVDAQLVVPEDAKGTSTVGVTVTFASGVTYTDTLVITVTAK